MSRLRSEIWCAAFVRRYSNLGMICVVARRGDASAGQVWLEIDHLDNTSTLYAPASALAYDEDAPDRLFEKRLERVPAHQIRERLSREAEFDPDFWLICLETRQAEIDIPLAPSFPTL